MMNTRTLERVSVSWMIHLVLTLRCLQVIREFDAQ